MMEKKSSWQLTIFVWFFVILAGVLGIIILGLGRELILTVGVQTFNMNRWVAPFVNNAYYFIAGLIWFAIFFYAEAYFSKGAQKSKLILRVTRYIGIQVLCIALIQVVLLLYRRFPFDTFSLLVTVVEILLVVGLLAYPYLSRLVQSRRISKN